MYTTAARYTAEAVLDIHYDAGSAAAYTPTRITVAALRACCSPLADALSCAADNCTALCQHTLRTLPSSHAPGLSLGMAGGGSAFSSCSTGMSDLRAILSA
jgi:hypothetical protein